MTMPKTAQKWTKFCRQIAHLSGAFLLLTLTQNTHADGTGKILKWKDEKGATHYGDRIPPQYANRESATINQQGITVKRNKPVSDQEQTLDIAKQDQDKKDKALLSAFTNENEIDLARDRNLQLDLITLENLQLDKSNVQKHLADNKKSADGFIKQKKKIPADLSADMASNQVTNAKLEQLIHEKKLAIETTRQRFESDKQRYIALKNHSATDSVPSAESSTPESLPAKNLAPSEVQRKR